MVPRHQPVIHIGGSSNSYSSSSNNHARPPKTVVTTTSPSRLAQKTARPSWWQSQSAIARRGGVAYKKESPQPRVSSSTCHAATSSSDHDESHNKKSIVRQQSLLPDRFYSSSHHFMQALGPTALLGGTAAAYSAVYRHPSCTLSPLSAFYLLLLALQTSIQPRLSRKYIKKSQNKQAVALCEEVVKTVLATALFISQDGSVVRKACREWSLSSSLAVAALPSVLYAAQGVLTYTAHQHLNAVTFNGLSQTKTVSAAIWCYLLLGKKQSPIQMLSIGILFLSALIFQGLLIRPQQQEQQSTQDTASKDNVRSSSSSSSGAHSRDSTWFAKGIVPCLGATFLSGLAGAFSQRGLQLVGGTGRNAFLFTIEISFFSALSLVISMAVNHYRNTNRNDNDKLYTTSSWTQVFSNKAARRDLRLALIPITVKAMGGILTALVHKHAGSVLKGFALVLGLVLSGLLQTVMDDERLTLHQGVGTLLVMLSSFMHFTNPPVPAKS